MRSSSSASRPGSYSRGQVTTTPTTCTSSALDDAGRTSPIAVKTDSIDRIGSGQSLCIEIAKGDDGRGGDSRPNLSTSTQSKKRVTWSTITVHEFGVGLGGSSISNKGGPPIGLAEMPEFTWTTKVGEMAECSEGVHRFSLNQRIRLLQAAGIPDGIITRHAREANIILSSRRRSNVSREESTEHETEKEGEKETSRKSNCKRSAEQARLEYPPTSVYLQRPRMIPVSYA
uniref:Uncharacterized protein n=1 Tax=Hyaloperonospora arabidopsidis (strain Emoy2) TaxID=559515 RepID=M4BBY9_HYAAE